MSSINLVNNILSPPSEMGFKVLETETDTDQTWAKNETTRPFALQKQSSFIHNIPSGLSHHASKLDLIDDTTLTSLPLPPPPPKFKRRHSGRNSVSSKVFPDTNLIRTVESSHSVPSEQNSTKDALIPNETIDDIIDETFEDTRDFDDTCDDSEDPIVLVEDYMNKEVQSPVAVQNYMVNRKKSLANFKQRICKKNFNFNFDVETNSISSKLSAITTHDSVSSLKTYRQTSGPTNLENWEAIFGKIPGSDKLKYCDLCEKPLYEISSIINSSTKKKLTELYTEFICWECIELYEEFFDELYQQEVNGSDLTIRKTSDSLTQQHEVNATYTKPPPGGSSKLLSIFQTVQEKYHQPPKKLKRVQRENKFSSDLLNKLHGLNDSANSFNFSMTQHQAQSGLRMSKLVDDDWVKNLQHKLRFRWRLNGLIPAFGKREYQS